MINVLINSEALVRVQNGSMENNIYVRNRKYSIIDNSIFVYGASPLLLSKGDETLLVFLRNFMN